MEVYAVVVGAIEENCFVLATEAKNAAVIDPGDDAYLIEELLAEKDLTVKMILLTHGHFDHIGAVKQIAEKWSVPVYAAAEEKLLLGSSHLNRAGNRFGDAERYEVTADYWLHDGDTFVLDELKIDVVATPGHTAGSLCYLCGDYMFSGDTLFAGDIGRCDLYSGDYNTMLQSLEKLKALEKDYYVLPGHGPVSTLSKEKMRNPYMTGEIR